MEESQHLKYEDPVNQVGDELEQSSSALQRGGVPKWMQIIDPGIGFAKVKARVVEARDGISPFSTLIINKCCNPMFVAFCLQF